MRGHQLTSARQRAVGATRPTTLHVNHYPTEMTDTTDPRPQKAPVWMAFRR